MSDGVCVNCGTSGRHYARGLCKRCYDYQRRTGNSRPLVHGWIKTIPWNKGLTKHKDARIAKVAQEKSVSMKNNAQVVQQMADMRVLRQGHWTETATSEKKQQVFAKIVETRRQNGTLGFTPEMTQKAVQTRKERGSYVGWCKGLKKGDPRLEKFVAVRQKGIREQSRYHTSYFRKKLSLDIKRRDGFRCQACKKKYSSIKLNVHHIDGDKQNDDSLNLITLCKVCHGQVTWKKDPPWQQVLPLVLFSVS